MEHTNNMCQYRRLRNSNQFLCNKLSWPTDILQAAQLGQHLLVLMPSSIPPANIDSRVVVLKIMRERAARFAVKQEINDGEHHPDGERVDAAGRAVGPHAALVACHGPKQPRGSKECPKDIQKTSEKVKERRSLLESVTLTMSWRLFESLGAGIGA